MAYEHLIHKTPVCPSCKSLTKVRGGRKTLVRNDEHSTSFKMYRTCEHCHINFVDYVTITETEEIHRMSRVNEAIKREVKHKY